MLQKWSYRVIDCGQYPTHTIMNYFKKTCLALHLGSWVWKPKTYYVIFCRLISSSSLTSNYVVLCTNSNFNLIWYKAIITFLYLWLSGQDLVLLLGPSLVTFAPFLQNKAHVTHEKITRKLLYCLWYTQEKPWIYLC